MADHMSFEELGLTDGITHLGAVDFLNPPPAASANEITGIGEPKLEAPALINNFKMGGFGL